MFCLIHSALHEPLKSRKCCFKLLFEAWQKSCDTQVRHQDFRSVRLNFESMILKERYQIENTWVMVTTTVLDPQFKTIVCIYRQSTTARVIAKYSVILHISSGNDRSSYSSSNTWPGKHMEAIEVKKLIWISLYYLLPSNLFLLQVQPRRYTANVQKRSSINTGQPGQELTLTFTSWQNDICTCQPH